MTHFSKSLACSVLAALLAVSAEVSAQTSNAPKKHSSQPQDFAEPGLNALLATAQAAMDRNDFAAAAQNYRDYLAKKPDSAFAHFQLGYACAALKQPAEARLEFEKAVALNPKMAEAQLNLGLTLIPTDPAAAIEPLQHAAELAPQDARTKWLLGVAFEASGKDALALRQYEEAEKLADKNPDIRNSLGGIFLRSNRIAEAEAQFRASLALHPAGGAAAEAHKGMAGVLIAEKKPELAVAELNTYLEIQPRDSSLRLERASLLADLGRNDEALAELNRAVTGASEGLEALMLRSRICYQSKKYDDAILALNKAATLAPNNPDLPARLGHIYFEKKEYANAVQQLLAAFKLDPKADDVLGELVTAEYLNKNYAATLKGLDLLSQRQSLLVSAWFVRADCYDKLGQPVQALEAYQKFLSLNKDENNDMYFEATARVRVLARELKDKKR